MQNNGPSLAQWRSDAFGILHKIYTAKSNVFVNDSGFTEQVDRPQVIKTTISHNFDLAQHIECSLLQLHRSKS